MIERTKVLAYITHGSRLLVLTHPESPEAGIQVPGGTVEAGEDIADAALREATEESGLTGLRLGALLGKLSLNRADVGLDEIHHRHYFHVWCDQTPPESWRHYEFTASDRPANHEPIPLDFHWVNLPDGVLPLIAKHDAFLPELIMLLKL